MSDTTTTSSSATTSESDGIEGSSRGLPEYIHALIGRWVARVYPDASRWTARVEGDQILVQVVPRIEYIDVSFSLDLGAPKISGPSA